MVKLSTSSSPSVNDPSPNHHHTTSIPSSPKFHSMKRAINLSWLLNTGLLCCLCSFCYILGTWQSSSPIPSSASSSSPTSSASTATTLATSSPSSPDCNIESKKSVSLSSSSRLDSEGQRHHSSIEGAGDGERGSISRASDGAWMEQGEELAGKVWAACDLRYSEYTPCEDTESSLRYERERLVYRERHCPDEEESGQGGRSGPRDCLIPAPPGYRKPVPWPKSRGVAWYANVPHRELTVEKAVQNWVQYDDGTRTFRFPGGGTMFPDGAKHYIDDIGALIRLSDGSIRTALDTGCGVASWGAYLLDRDILTMSFAPRDTHEAQVQFALERGVPAMLGVMASQRLPYPARAFDMAHCSRCLIPWKDYDGVYLIEVDRLLRPGGYWILSGPPINWEIHWKGWQRTKEDLAEEQEAIESLARSLCWKKVIQKGNLAVWQKPWNHIDCIKTRRVFKNPPMCKNGEEGQGGGDAAWYTKMETCITPLPDASDRKEVAGGALSKWPARLSAVPPRILAGTLAGVSSSMFIEDMETWRTRVDYYKGSLVPNLGIDGHYRNIMDMNAGFGGFAATLAKDRDSVWVMNVVPTSSKHNTLGVIYERGLIGTYQDWCEAFSTYPRTYDLIHADTIFGMYQERCNMDQILVEMDRILRPEGTVIIRDDVDVMNKVARIASSMRWKVRLADHESGPFNPQKILIAVKTYWVGSVSNSTQAG